MGILKRIAKRVVGTAATYVTQKVATKVAEKVSRSAAKRKVKTINPEAAKSKTAKP